MTIRHYQALQDLSQPVRPMNVGYSPVLAVGSDGTVWFEKGEADSSSSTVTQSIVAMTSTGAVLTEIVVPRWVNTIKAGAGGVWFLAADDGNEENGREGSRVGRLWIDRPPQVFPVSGNPIDAVEAAGDAMWVADSGDSTVMRVFVDGHIQSFPVGASSAPARLARALDGAAWFSTYDSEYWLGKVTRTGEVSLFRSPFDEPGWFISAMAAASDGGVWVVAGGPQMMSRSDGRLAVELAGRS